MSQSTKHRAGTYRGTEHLTDSEYYDLLASDRRRMTLDILTTSTVPIELETLAAAIADRERDADAATEVGVERIASLLHHTHLPKMDELDVIDYDPDTTRISAF